MRKMKKLAALLCAVIMVLTLLPVQTWATEEGTLYSARYDAVAGEMRREKLPDGTVLHPFPTDEQDDAALFADGEVPEIDPYFSIIDENLPRYGYDALAQMANGEALTDFYAILATLAFYYYYNSNSDYPEYFEFPDSVTYTYSMEEAALVTQAFYADWPEIFWMWPGFLYDANSVCVGIDMGYNNHASDLEQEQQLFLSAANSILAGMPADGTDYEKELYLHDALVNHVTYDMNYVEEQNAYSALVNGKAVCAGYAFALQYLLMRAGIESYYVVGTAGVDKDGKPVGHAWNIAKIDGTWYYVDATWDDSDDEYAPYHGYFNITTAMLETEHTLDPIPYNVPLPACTATDAFYHTVNGSIVSTADSDLVEKVAGLLLQNDGVACLYVTDENAYDTTWAWYQNNIDAIADAVRASDEYSYGCNAFGNEIVLTFTGSILYPFTGDANGDDAVDIRDMQLLYTYLITDTFPVDQTDLIEYYFLSAADVNGDKHVDVYDLQALYEMVAAA